MSCLPELLRLQRARFSAGWWLWAGPTGCTAAAVSKRGFIAAAPDRLPHPAPPHTLPQLFPDSLGQVRLMVMLRINRGRAGQLCRVEPTSGSPAGFEKWKGGMAGRAAELVWFPSHSSWLQKEVTNEPSLVKERKGSAQRPWD